MQEIVLVILKTVVIIMSGLFMQTKQKNAKPLVLIQAKP